MAVNVQNHIHISTSLSGSPEYSPTLKWTIRDREEGITFRAEVVDTLSGNVYAHVIKSSGEPVVRFDFNYEVKIIGDISHNAFYYLDLLTALAGKEVYLTDTYHPDDGEDHSDYTETYFVSQIGPIPTNHFALAFFYVPIQLKSLRQPT